MQSIGLVEAITSWFSGRKVDEAALYGLPVVWISRVGKIVAFASGLTVVLDVIGPTKIIEYGEKLSAESGIWFEICITLIGLPLLPLIPAFIVADLTDWLWLQIVVVILFGLIMLGSILCFLTYFPGLIVTRIGKFFEKREYQARFRRIALWFLFSGFFIDMFTS